MHQNVSSRALLWVAAVSASVVVAVYIAKTRKRQRNKSRLAKKEGEPSKEGYPGGVPPGARLLSPHVQPVVLEPGLVLLKGALTLEAQLLVARDMLVCGHGQRRFWCQGESRNGLPTTTPRGPPRREKAHARGREAPTGRSPGESMAAAPLEWQLTGERQGRGRVYDALGSFPAHEALAALCRDCVDLCGRLPGAHMPGAMPGALTATSTASLGREEKAHHTGSSGATVEGGAVEAVGGVRYEATHLLLLYYALERKLGWHRDNGAIDGSSSLPVVSLSLGNACDFEMKHAEKDAVPAHLKLRLESGDVLLFGGAVRHALHTVSAIHPGTTPPALVALQEGVQRALAPPCQREEEKAASLPKPGSASARASTTPGGRGFRMNLTFRHAPELRGQEAEERFYHFASATRGFLQAQRDKGTAAARAEANSAQQKRRHEKQARREMRQQQAAEKEELKREKVTLTGA